MLKKAIDGKFMRAEHEEMWEVVATADEVLPAIANAKKWHESARGFAAI